VRGPKVGAPEDLLHDALIRYEPPLLAKLEAPGVQLVALVEERLSDQPDAAAVVVIPADPRRRRADSQDKGSSRPFSNYP
jgi:hypothetical protein